MHADPFPPFKKKKMKERKRFSKKQNGERKSRSAS